VATSCPVPCGWSSRRRLQSRTLLYWVSAWSALAFAWLIVGRLDIVAVASGKLAPRTSIKIVQPSDAAASPKSR
jgi:hypothetical protein